MALARLPCGLSGRFFEVAAPFFIQEPHMRVKYIGQNVKTDSITGVGLIWQPGQVRDVTSAVAEHLLAYTDTWTKTEDGEATDEPVDFRETNKIPDEPLPVVNFHEMDKKALEKYSMEQWNEKFDKRMSVDVIRERVIKRHSSEAMDSKLS